MGGLLFATGAVVLFTRKQDAWAAFPLFLVLFTPAALLYGLGIGAAGRAPASWQSVFLVYGVVLVPLALGQLIDAVGGNPDASGHVAWIFLAAAGLAALASFTRGATYLALVMALALVVAWLSFWDAVLGDPSLDTVRWLLVVLAAGFLAGAVALRSVNAELRQPPELITAAGLAAVAAGAVSLADVLVPVLFFFGDEPDIEGSSFFWELFLVAVSVALIVYGARGRVRGPAYIGAFGLAAFSLIVGIDTAALIQGDSGGGDVVGWPLVLLVLGAMALFAGMQAGRQGSADR